MISGSLSRLDSSCHRLLDRICSAIVFVTLLAFILLVFSVQSLDAADENTTDKRLTVALLSFADKTGDPKLSHWRYSLPRAVGSPLEEAKALRIYPADACDYGLRKLKCKAGDPIDSAQAKKIGEIIEARRVVRGEYRRKDDQWTLTVHVMNVSTGKESEPLSATASDWFDVCDEVAAKILKELDMDPIEQTESVRSRIRFTTSATALEFYSQSYALMMENKPWGELEVLARKAVAADPKSAMMRVGLATCLLNQGKLEEGTKEIHEAIKLDSDLAGPHEMLGYLMMIQNRNDESGRYYREALRLDPDDAKMHSRMAEYHASQGVWEKAISSMREALRLNPVSARYRATLGGIYARQGDKNKALIELKEAEYLGIDEVNSLQVAALTYEKLNMVPQAIACYEKFVTLARAQGLNPKLVDPFAETLVKLKASLTPVYVSATEPKVYSEKSLREALLARSTEDEMALINLPLASTPEMKRWAEKLTDGATTDLEKARKLYDALACHLDPGPGGIKTARETFADWEKPQASFHCQEYARLYVALARDVGLKAYFVMVEKDFENNNVLHACAGVFLDGKALLVDPSYRWFGVSHKQFVFDDDLVAIVNQLNQSGDLPRSRLAVKLQPDSVMSQFNLALTLIELKQSKEAGQVLQTALKLDSECGLAQYAQGVMNFMDGQPELALPRLSKAVELNPSSAISQFYLARTFWDLGRLQESRQAFRKCLNYRPNSKMEANSRHSIAIINEKLGAENTLESTGVAGDDPQKIGQLDGLVTLLHENGQKKEESNFKNGKQEGLTTRWHENGQKKEEGNFKDGQLEGLVTQWHENGQKAGEATYKLGKKNGPSANWHKNGQKSEEGNFKNGQLDGVATKWHESGQKSAEITYKDGKQEGPYTMWHENGKKSEEGNFKNGQLDGVGTKWHESGQKSAEITYKDGKQEGPYTMWHENGKKSEEGNFKNGQFEGLATSWNESGQKAEEFTYKLGKKNGPYTNWHKNGKKAEEGTFKDGQLEGLVTLWNDNGQKAVEVTYKFGKKNGSYIEWYENGKKREEGTFKDGQLKGLVTLWNDNGQKAGEATYKLGKKNGPTANWHKNGKKAAEGTLKDGMLEGLATQWHENGNKKQDATFKDGTQEGLVTEWYESGKKSEEGIYKNGKPEGPFTKWHENGQRELEGIFKQGKQEGLVTKWHESGKKAGEATYKNGQLEGAYTNWHETGEKSEEGNYKDGKQEGLVTLWHENGKKAIEVTYKNGKQEGAYTKWHETGEKSEEGTFKDGQLDGVATQWKVNGEVIRTQRFKNGKPVFENEPDLADPAIHKKIVGDALEWSTLKKDELTGLYHAPDDPATYTGWAKKLHGNGKVALLGAFKNGQPEGLWTWWDENGVKEDEQRHQPISP